MKKACEKWVTACLSCQQVKNPRKLRFPLQSIESSEFNEVVQIDHQKISMTDSGYNQVLVMIDHFTKYAEAVRCITASAEETCDHLINTWIARHGCPMTFQSDNGTASVEELTKELMRRSQFAQAHFTTASERKPPPSWTRIRKVKRQNKICCKTICPGRRKMRRTSDHKINTRDKKVCPGSLR